MSGLLTAPQRCEPRPRFLAQRLECGVGATPEAKQGGVRVGCGRPVAQRDLALSVTNLGQANRDTGAEPDAPMIRVLRAASGRLR